MGGRRRAKRGSQKGVEIKVEKVVDNTAAKRIRNKGKSNTEDQHQHVIVNAPTPQALAADTYDEDAWLGYNSNFEDMTLTALDLEGSTDFVVEVEEGMILDDQSESCVGDTRGENKDDDDFNCGNYGKYQQEEVAGIPKTDQEEDNQSDSDDSENEREPNHPGNNDESESKNIAIVVNKIRTKAMDYATREKLNIFAVLLTVHHEQYLVKVSQLDGENDVLIRAGKIHFRNKPGISTQKILKEDGLYKRCRYSIVAKFQEVRDDFEEGKLNLVVVPIMASDERNNNLSPDFMSRKMFFNRSKLYKNCQVLQYTIVKKLMTQFSTKRKVKLEPIDEADESKENCGIDPNTGEIMERSGEQEKEVKPKRAYTRRKDPAALNSNKSKSKKGAKVKVKIEQPEPEESMETMEEEVGVGLEDVQDPPALNASKSKSKSKKGAKVKVKIEQPEPEETVEAMEVEEEVGLEDVQVPAVLNASKSKSKSKKGAKVKVKIEQPEPEESVEAMEEEVGVGLEDVNQVENEAEVEKPSTSAEGKESSKDAPAKPTRKSKRRGRRGGPGRPSKKSKQAQKDVESEVETALKAELTGLLEFQKAMEMLALENETEDDGLPAEVEEKVVESTSMEVEVPELGRRRRIIKKKKIFE